MNALSIFSFQFHLKTVKHIQAGGMHKKETSPVHFMIRRKLETNLGFGDDSFRLNPMSAETIVASLRVAVASWSRCDGGVPRQTLSERTGT